MLQNSSWSCKPDSNLPLINTLMSLVRWWHQYIKWQSLACEATSLAAVWLLQWLHYMAVHEINWRWKWNHFGVTVGLGSRWLFNVSTNSLNDFSFGTFCTRRFCSDVYVLQSNALNSTAACLPSACIGIQKQLNSLNRHDPGESNCSMCPIVADATAQ